MIVKNYENKTWIERREAFLDYCSSQQYNPQFKVCQMWIESDVVNSTSSEVYCYFNPNINTRNVLNTEVDIEFDKPVNWNMSNEEFFNEYSLPAICKTSLNLISKQIHFTIWYADFMESPYIRIYDIIPEEIPNKVRVHIRKLFIESVVPAEYFHLLDKSFFHNKKICLEFSKHWKYRTMLKLILEYIPEVKLCNN